MRNTWEPRTGRTPEYAIWHDELIEVLIKLGLSEANIKEKPPEKPEEATRNVDACNLWADAVEQYQDQGTCIFDAARGSLLHLSAYTQMPPTTVPASFTDWMTAPDGVSRCRLAPMCDLVFTTPTGKGR